MHIVSKGKSIMRLLENSTLAPQICTLVCNYVTYLLLMSCLVVICPLAIYYTIGALDRVELKIAFSSLVLVASVLASILLNTTLRRNNARLKIHTKINSLAERVINIITDDGINKDDK